MNKFLNLLKLIYKKYINLRKESTKIYSKSFENECKSVLSDYIGKILLTLIFALVFISNWTHDKTQNFEAFQMATPTLVIFWICMLTGIGYIIVSTLIFLRKQNFWLAQSILWIHNQIMYPLNEKLNDNIFGVILTNLVLLAGLYNRNWQEFINLWQTSPKSHASLIMQLILFLVYTVITPYFFCIINTVVSRILRIYSTMNNNIITVASN